MTNYKKKYLKYKLKYLKLKQTGGCIGFDCFGYKNSKKREDSLETQDNSIKANIFIYVNGGKYQNFDFIIDKNKTSLETKNDIFKYLKNEFEFFKDEIKDEIKYFYEPNIKIEFGDIELSDDVILNTYDDMADGAVINIYFNLKKITCALCGKQDDIDSNNYVYELNKETNEYQYVHYDINLCLEYVRDRVKRLKVSEKERITRTNYIYSKIQKFPMDPEQESSALDREKKKSITTIVN